LHSSRQTDIPGCEEAAMKRNMAVAIVIFLLALLASSVAWAGGSFHGRGFSHHGHGHHAHRHQGHGHHRSQGRVDIIIGAPLAGSWYYRTHPGYYAQPPYYAYSYPPAIAMQSSPPVYIERGDQQDEKQDQLQLQQPPAHYYYCTDPQGYYPYVRVCPRGWEQVPAQPSPTP
jgi:hypothetical protein